MIECCGKKQKSFAFMCDPPEGWIFQRIDFLVWCKHCKRTVLQVSRYNARGEFSSFRRTETQARELFERMRSSILYKIKEPYTVVPQHGDFWLGYSEFGVKKRCYSNLSALRDVGESLDLPMSNKLILPRKNDAKQHCSEEKTCSTPSF